MRRKQVLVGLSLALIVGSFGVWQSSRGPAYSFLDGLQPGFVELSGSPPTYREEYYITGSIHKVKNRADPELRAAGMKELPSGVGRFSIRFLSSQSSSHEGDVTVDFVGYDKAVARRHVRYGAPARLARIPKGTTGIIAIQRGPSAVDRARAWLYKALHP